MRCRSDTQPAREQRKTANELQGLGQVFIYGHRHLRRKMSVLAIIVSWRFSKKITGAGAVGSDVSCYDRRF